MNRPALQFAWLAVISAVTAVMSFPGVGSAQAPVYKITSAGPVPIAAGAPGATLILGGTLPPFPSATIGVCFYTGYGSTAVVPLAAINRVVIPASPIQDIPPASFSGGTFTASAYFEDTSTTCNGVSSIKSPAYSIPIVLPAIYSDSPTLLQQENSALGIAPPPSLISLTGEEFLANTTATFAWTGGSAQGTVFLSSPFSLNATLPAFPASTSYLTLTVCNHAPSYDYCAEAVDFEIDPLAPSGGTLTVSPSPVPSGSSATLTAQFGATGPMGPSGATGLPGAPTGTVSFTVNGSPVGTAPLILDQATGNLTQAYDNQITSQVSGPVRMADVNHDGIPDVVSFDTSGTVEVELGTIPFGLPGPGIFSSPDSECGTVVDLQVADLNGDGYPDLVFLCNSSGTYTTEVALGLGDGTFASAVSINGAYGNQIAIGYVTGGKFPDIVVAGATNACAPTCALSSGFAVFTDDGLGNFTAYSVTTTSSSPGTQLLLADVDGDGHPDIVELNPANSSVDIYLNKGGGGTSFGITSGTLNSPDAQIGVSPRYTLSNLFTGDFNGDGHPDLGALLVDGSDVEVLFLINQNPGVGNVSFSDTNSFSIPSAPISVAAADFNGDHMDDIAVTTVNGVTVYDSNGKEFNQNYPGLTANPGATVIASLPVDLDADGDADVMFLTQSVNPAGGYDDYLTSYLTSGLSNATLTTSLAGSGEVPVVATWPGDVNITGSTANTSVEFTGPVITSSTTISSAPNPSQYGQTVMITATVTGSDGGTPTGSVIFEQGTNPLGTVPMVGGTAVLNIATLTVGSHSINAIYSGDSTYPTGYSNTVVQMVTPATPVIFWLAPAPIAYGTPLSATQLDAVAIGSGGALTGTFTYKPAAGIVLPAGADQPLTVVFTPSDSSDYNNASGSTTITVTKINPTISWTAPAPIAYGTPLSATQLNATAAAPGVSGPLAGSFAYTPAAGTVLGAGNGQTLGAIFTPTDITDYNVVPAGTTINVTKATPTTSWAVPGSITYGTPLDSDQLDATATGISGPLAGTFVYTPAAGTILGVGVEQVLRATFTPTDTTDYNTAPASTAINVTKATPTVSWATPAPITYGTPLSATQLDATATGVAGALAGSFVYTPRAPSVLSVGNNQPLQVVFTPTDTADYNTANGSTTINVTKANPPIVWASPAAIAYGTPLSATQLDATATGPDGNLPGSFVYTPAAGTVLSAGNNQTLSATFTPSDTADYNTIPASTTINVTKATPTVAWTAPAAITYGTALSATQLDATATGLAGPLAGSFAYTPAAGTVLSAGNAQTLSATFTPTDIIDYNTAPASTSINVTKATPTVAWTAPAAITYGTALSATQLDATATGLAGPLAGSFVYTPAAGTVLNAGNEQSLSATFTPTDITDYATARVNTIIDVSKATPTITWPPPASIVAGTPLSDTQLDATAAGVAGPLAGTFVYLPASGTVLSAGNQTLGLTFTPTDITDYIVATASNTLSVLNPNVIVTSISPATAVLGDATKTLTFIGTGFLSNSVVQVNGAALATTYISSTSLTAVMPASYFLASGTLYLTVVNPTQNISSASIPFVVTSPTLQVVFSGPTSVLPTQQPTLTFTLVNPYPVPLSGTLDLAFAGAGGADDPSIQFATGGRTSTFTIAANSVITPTIEIQAGTDAGTITVTLGLFAGGQNVTPASLQPIVIVVPPVAPVITSATLTRSGDTVTMNIVGFSNTREATTALFQFIGANGANLTNPDLTIDATSLFANWFSSNGSQTYGSAFTYTQTFNLSTSASSIGSVSVTLTNSAGTSTTATAQ